MMKRLTSPLLILLLGLLPALAQNPGAFTNPANPSPTPAASSGSSSGGSPSGGGNSSAQSGFNLQGGSDVLGEIVPFYNPSDGTMQMDGKVWKIDDNRLFRARFEKYLNAPEETERDDIEYNDLINQIIDLLAPGEANKRSSEDRNKTNMDVAFGLLTRASDFSRDAQLCDAIASSVYSVWTSRKEKTRIDAANKEIDRQLRTHQWNLQTVAGKTSISNPGSNESNNQPSNEQTKREIRMAAITERIVTLKARQVANEAKQEAGEILAKLQFQSLILQHFVQRRFQHVVIGTRFYRAIFSDGDEKLEVGEDAKDLFASLSQGPPTLSALDSLATESIRDVDEGVKAYLFLVDKNEMASASQRLAEAFFLGEYLPPIRTLPRSQKRLALKFNQKASQLLSAYEVRDYALMEKLAGEIKEVATDFDDSKVMAAVQNAKAISAIHLQKALSAAASGDSEATEKHLRDAASIWPRNPKLAEVSKKIFETSNVQNQALIDFDRLLQQRNYRLIEEQKVKFLVGLSQHPEKLEQLQQIITDVNTIKMTTFKAEELSKRGDHAGAWETVEAIYEQFPNDNKLNQLRATYTTEASDFVKALRRARNLEDKDQTGSGLAWYLRARRIYPPSQFANEGIKKLAKKIIPSSEE